jgi:hypothetical protein
MADTSDRDARRWAAYERLVGDPSASESERVQAGEHLAALRARYPNGRPAPPGERRYAHGTGWSRRPRGWPFAEEPPPEPPPEAPEARRARMDAEARARDVAVEQQRANVERVPGWTRSSTLQELHESRAPWSSEEQQRFKEQRARLTGSSRAVDL